MFLPFSKRQMRKRNSGGSDWNSKNIGLILLIAILIVGGVGAYFLLRPQPDFQVNNLSLSQNEVAVGKTVTAQVEVLNMGNAEGTHTVRLEVGDETLKKKVTLGPNESKTVSFDIEKQEKGTYNINIEDLSETLEVVEPASFELSDLQISPKDAEPGETVTVSVDVQNTGEIEGTHTIKLEVNGNVENTRTVTLEKEESTSVSFNIQRSTSNSYPVRVEELSGSFKVLEPAEFEISNLQVSPSEVGVGGTVEISVDVKNTGEVMEAYAVSIKIDGEEEYTEEITLDGGKEGTISFETSKETKKTYLVEVSGLENSFSVASVSELISAYFSPSVTIGNLVEQVSYGLGNGSNQVITITKFEYYEEGGELRNIVTSEEIEDIWGTGEVNPGDSFTGTTDFRTGQPTKEQLGNWEYKFYCQDSDGSEFTVLGEYWD